MSAASSPSPSWPPGYRIHPCAPALSDEIVAFYRDVPAACVADCLGRSVGSTGLRAYHGDGTAKLCGNAVTVRVRPGDNLMIHKAMLMASVGDVIVVDGSGDVTQALIGGLMRTTAIQRKLGGFVIDGAIRDVAEWGDGRMPVYARGHTPRGPSKDGPGEINVLVSCAGMAVQPGDLVIGDDDGVVVVPRADLAHLRVRVAAHMRREADIRAVNARQGGDSARFDAILKEKGVPT